MPKLRISLDVNQWLLSSNLKLIACPSSPTIQIVFVKKKHLELSDYIWILGELSQIFSDTL